MVPVTLAALLWSGCGGSEHAPAPAPPQRVAAPAPTPAPDQGSFTASGPLVVENQVDVAAQREGVVSELLADTGTGVKKDQLLGQLDDRQIAADLEAASAKVRSIEANLKNWESEAKVLEADYQRAQKLWDAQLITKEQLEHARYAAQADQFEVTRERESLNNARATRDSLALERDKTRILAPFSGIVARRYVRVGQRVAVGDRLFWVTATGPLRVKFALPERFLGSVHKGDTVAVSSADVPGASHAARVILVSPVVDPSSGSIEVTAQLEGEPGEFRPGMTANIRVDTRR
jgi:membrane fusion protein (multidrug efflux system)